IRAAFDSYTSGDRPWLLLDTYYRNMEKRYHNLDWEIGDSLERLIIKARERYMDAASKMAERFLQLYQHDGFEISGVLRQVEIFEKIVKPALEEGKIAYVWADALRFEMARELLWIMSPEFQGEIMPALAAAPTITEIGMAALLPGSASGAIVQADEGKLALEIEGEVIRNREERVKFLQKKTTHRFFEATLDNLLPKPSVPVSKAIQNADLVLITSQEIDDLCEKDNPSLARTFMNELLSRMQKAIRNLSRLGIKKIVVTSDHGYLFGDELGVDMKIDPPGGDTADLHRRVWVGRGGASDPAYLRAKISDLGLGGDLELASPWSFACFRAKSRSMSYFHGGLSPQEIIIPVLTLVPKVDEKKVGGKIAWSMDCGDRKLTTRYFSVNVSGKERQSISDSEPPKIKVEIRDGGTCISKAVSASYGFEDATGVVQMRKANWAIEPNTITLSIEKDPSTKKVSLHLLDATTDVELAPSKEVEVAMLSY
ncbi:MAG: PglZ domain-containing protein, partial [Methanotrichaceae archaeon]|nr:PglZ domain-containing protein [Methanotrichaceae archaeon]